MEEKQRGCSRPSPEPGGPVALASHSCVTRRRRWYSSIVSSSFLVLLASADRRGRDQFSSSLLAVLDQLHVARVKHFLDSAFETNTQGTVVLEIESGANVGFSDRLYTHRPAE